MTFSDLRYAPCCLRAGVVRWPPVNWRRQLNFMMGLGYLWEAMRDRIPKVPGLETPEEFVP